MPELLTVSRAARLVGVDALGIEPHQIENLQGLARHAIAAVEHQFGDRALQHAFPEAPARAP